MDTTRLCTKRLIQQHNQLYILTTRNILNSALRFYAQNVLAEIFYEHLLILAIQVDLQYYDLYCTFKNMMEISFV